MTGLKQIEQIKPYKGLQIVVSCSFLRSLEQGKSGEGIHTFFNKT
tara:strand:+ start:783 stop:917 length:135 start_codon:yes stop_codon:yes gene_type:complete